MTEHRTKTTINESISILDSTLRDGRYLGNWKTDLTSLLVGKLVACGVKLIEIGPELGLGNTSSSRFNSRHLIFDDITKASYVKLDGHIGSFFIPGVGSDDDLRQARESGLDFIRIGQSPTTWTTALKSIELAITLGFQVFFNLMKSHLISAEEFGKIAKHISDFPISGLYLVDSVGTLLPDEVKAYVLEARNQTSLTIGFHGHNNLGLAHANSITAWRCGATIADGTLGGMGRGGGNASTEILSGLCKKLGAPTSTDTKELCRLAKNLQVEGGNQVPDQEYLEIVCGVFGFHSSWLPTIRDVAAVNEVAEDQLVERVAAINREDPTLELFQQVALNLAKSKT